MHPDRVHAVSVGGVTRLGTRRRAFGSEDGFPKRRQSRSVKCEHGRVAKRGRARGTFVAGVLLVAVALALTPFVPVGSVSLVPGLVLCVAAAALFVSQSSVPQTDTGQVSARAARRQGTVAVGVLAGLTLTPFGVVGILAALGADPLAIYLVGLGLFALSAILALVFVAVYVVGRWSQARREYSALP